MERSLRRTNRNILGSGRWAALALGGGLVLASQTYADTDSFNGGEVRAIDGSNNNLAHPDWGTPGTPTDGRGHLVREASGTHYTDGISAMARPNGPSPAARRNAPSVGCSAVSVDSAPRAMRGRGP